MGPASAACGIDFGTSNSTAAWAPQGRATLLALEDGKATLPSVVFFHAEDSRVSYGREALADYLSGDEGRLMRSLKSLLGTSMIDDHTEVAGRALPFRELLAQFIGELKRRAEAQAGQPFTRAVMGRPVFFVDDDPKADRQAQDTLAGIAGSVGLKDIAFQYEPIAAAFDYESHITREELVLVVDIGGGTSDFCLVRLSPERATRLERRDDILASGGVHVGGTDFDKYLSLASVMPSLGLGSRLQTGLVVPSGPYFNLATWHTINQVYSRKSWTLITELRRDALEPKKIERLQNLVEERAGHWLAMQVEAAKIALSDAPITQMDLGRIAVGETLTLHRADLDRAIGHLVEKIEITVARLLTDAGIRAGELDTVFFTGGSSGVPLLRERISALLPNARAVEGDLFGSIGTGLAIDALRKFR
ncbi:Hsp70 family protein [soil metagenome]